MTLPILKTALLPYELSQFLKVESFDSKTDFNTVLVKYLMLGIENNHLNQVKDWNKESEKPPCQTIYIPPVADNFLTQQSKDTKIDKNILCVNYIVAGIEQNKQTLSQDLKMWFNELNKTLKEMK